MIKNVLFLLAAIILLAGCSGTDKSSDALTVINVTDFGAIPDDGKDDTPAVRAALDKIKNIKGKTILYFPEGRYDFFSTSASVAHYPVTAVHKQWDFVTPFHLDGFEDLTIVGNGSAFIMHQRMTPFVLNACRNVTISRLSIEHVRPSVFELRVVDKGIQVINFEAIGDDTFLIEDGQLVWLDANRVTDFAKEGWMVKENTR